MTEAEWLECANSSGMVSFLGGQLSARKLRLFVCACCRSSWHLLTDKRSRQAVEISERFADGVANKMNLETALANAKAAERIIRSQLQEKARRHGMSQENEAFQLAWREAEAAAKAQKTVEADAWKSAMRVSGTWAESESTRSYSFAHDIFGNPFRTITIDPRWLTPTVQGI